VEITKEVKISKYMQHSLPSVIKSQTCPAHIVLLLLDIVPRTFSTCKISTYIVVRQVNQASEWGQLPCGTGLYRGWVLDLPNRAFFSAQWTADLEFLIANVQWLCHFKIQLKFSNFTFKLYIHYTHKLETYFYYILKTYHHLKHV
jgi:hypothetical protein